MKTIYVAGPYSGVDENQVHSNIANAEKASILLLNLGWCVIIPHKNFAYYEIRTSLDYDFFMECCIELLGKCDAIFILEGWEKSKGARLEHLFAKKAGIEIYYEKDGYPQPET